MTTSLQHTEAEQRRARLTGIALMCAAVLSFACLDATAKYLNGYMDTLQVVWARYTGAFILTLFIFNPVSRPGMMRTTRPFLQLGRSAMLLGSTATNFLSATATLTTRPAPFSNCSLTRKGSRASPPESRTGPWRWSVRPEASRP